VFGGKKGSVSQDDCRFLRIPTRTQRRVAPCALGAPCTLRTHRWSALLNAQDPPGAIEFDARLDLRTEKETLRDPIGACYYAQEKRVDNRQRTKKKNL